jgi:hypothetical protein
MCSAQSGRLILMDYYYELDWTVDYRPPPQPPKPILSLVRGLNSGCVTRRNRTAPTLSCLIRKGNPDNFRRLTPTFIFKFKTKQKKLVPLSVFLLLWSRLCKYF